jgi:hypothetical protein
MKTSGDLFASDDCIPDKPLRCRVFAATARPLRASIFEEPAYIAWQTTAPPSRAGRAKMATNMDYPPIDNISTKASRPTGVGGIHKCPIQNLRINTLSDGRA